MSTAVPSLPSTLDSAQRAFDHWRATRVQRAHTPISLQRQAVALLSEHKPAHICAALKINDTALKRWEQSLRLSPTTQASPPLVSADADNGFIRLPAERCIAAEKTQPNQVSTVAIELGNGVSLNVEGRFALDEILRLACHYQQEQKL